MPSSSSGNGNGNGNGHRPRMEPGFANQIQQTLFPSDVIGGVRLPSFTPSGRLFLPSNHGEIQPEAYIQLMHLYSQTLEADRLIAPFRKDLALKPKKLGPELAYAVTELTPSTQQTNLFYKREDQTVIKAYKARGAFCGMRRVMETEGVDKFVAASTGNHAMGVLRAAELLRPKQVQIVVPNNTAGVKLKNINSKVLALRHRGVDATVIYIGDTFDDARTWAVAQHNQGAYYLDPYSNPWVVAGQGTIGLELVRQLTPVVEANPQLDTLRLISPIGGGGLLAGTATALTLATAWDARFRGLRLSVTGLKLATLSSVYGDAIRVKKIAEGNQWLFDTLGVQVLKVVDAEMAEGMKGVYADIGDRVEGPSGVTWTQAKKTQAAFDTERTLTVCLLSGGNVSEFPRG
jgi:threonine dehydratase